MDDAGIVSVLLSLWNDLHPASKSSADFLGLSAFSLVPALCGWTHPAVHSLKAFPPLCCVSKSFLPSLMLLSFLFFFPALHSLLLKLQYHPQLPSSQDNCFPNCLLTSPENPTVREYHLPSGPSCCKHRVSNLHVQQGQKYHIFNNFVYIFDLLKTYLQYFLLFI